VFSLLSATGHLFLTFVTPEEAAGALENDAATAERGGAIDVPAIRKQLRETMSDSVDELLIPGPRATAVPILDIQERAALVVTVMATPAFDRGKDQAVVDALK
jgi:DNA-binding IclR family transcriptional regulator